MQLRILALAIFGLRLPDGFRLSVFWDTGKVFGAIILIILSSTLYKYYLPLVYTLGLTILFAAKASSGLYVLTRQNI